MIIEFFKYLDEFLRFKVKIERTCPSYFCLLPFLLIDLLFQSSEVSVYFIVL